MTDLIYNFQDNDDEVIDYPGQGKGEKEQNKPLNYPSKNFSEKIKEEKKNNKNTKNIKPLKE